MQVSTGFGSSPVAPGPAGRREFGRVTGTFRLASRREELRPRSKPSKGELNFEEELLSALPNLRAFALSLTRDLPRAEDLLQETLARAWEHRADFERGTNMGAWLFTILRNLFRSEHRRRKREVPLEEEGYARRAAVLPSQEAALEAADLRSALQKLPPAQRQAVLAVALEGLSYECAGALLDTPAGTIKSRVNRAREKLRTDLGYERHNEIGAGSLLKAALQAA